MDAGRGAVNPVHVDIIKAVSKAIYCPLVVGGGIRSGQQAYDILLAGADMIVVGNRVEEDPNFLSEIQEATKQINAELR